MPKVPHFFYPYAPFYGCVFNPPPFFFVPHLRPIFHVFCTPPLPPLFSMCVFVPPSSLFHLVMGSIM